MDFIRAARQSLALGYLTPVIVVGVEWRLRIFGPHGEGLLRALLSLGVLMLLSALALGYLRLAAAAPGSTTRAPWLRRLALLGLYGPAVGTVLLLAAPSLLGS